MDHEESYVSFFVLTLIQIPIVDAQQKPDIEMTAEQAIAAIKRLDDDVTADENRISLQFHDNLNGDTLAPLHSLPQLKTLWLNWSKVDDAGLAHVRGLTNLQELGLSATQVTDAGLGSLKKLLQLKSLSLEQTKIGGMGLKHISGLTKLEYLNLERTLTDDAGLEHLKDLVKLKELNLTLTKITGNGMVHLKDMTDLESLELCYTGVDGKGMEHLQGMRQLQYLRLFNTNLDDSGMVYLAKLTNLKDLSLHCTKITDSGLIHLKELKNLTSLTLNGTGMTDAGLVHLQGLKKLNVLFLNDRVTNAGMAKLQAILPNCSIGRYDEETNVVTKAIAPKKMIASNRGDTTSGGQPKPKPDDAKKNSTLHAPRIWTDFTGNFKLEARFTRMDGGFAVFERADTGREFRLTMNKLSKEDRAFLERELGLSSAPTNIPKPKPAAQNLIGQSRAWTDSTGRFNVKAKLLQVKGDLVVLEREDNGEKIRISINRLSKTDQQFLKSQNRMNKPTAPAKSSAKKYPLPKKSNSSTNRKSVRSSRSKFSPKADGTLAIAGFNSRKGLGISGRIRAVYPLDALNREGGGKEYGWSNPWPQSPKAIFQTQTVYEGDGALHVAGTANYGRSFGGPLTGLIEVEQVVRYPEGGDLTSRIWETNAYNSGPMWRLEKGRFKTLDGDGRGGGKWHDTGIPVNADQWIKVVIEIDESKKKWKLKLPEKEYISPEHSFRGTPKQLLRLNYLTETKPGIFIDAVQIRQIKQD